MTPDPMQNGNIPVCWIPVLWKVSDSTNDVFSQEAPFLAEFSLGKEGQYKIFITYKEEIFDGVNWQETGQIHRVEELGFCKLK